MISPMKKVLLAGRTHEREQVLTTLRESGVVHAEPLADKPTIPENLANEIARALQAQSLLASITPAQDGLAPPGTPPRLVAEIIETARQKTAVAAEILTISQEIEAVRPWGKIDHAVIEQLRNAGVEIALLKGPQAAETPAQAELTVVLSDCQGIAYMLAASRTTIIPPPGWERITIPEKDLSTLQEELNALNDQARELAQKAVLQAKRRADVDAYAAELLENRRFAEVEAGLLLDDAGIFFLQGWVPVSAIAELQQRLDTSGLPVALHLKDPTEDEQPPTKLENARWCTSIEDFYTFLGLVPGYREADITPTFLPFMVIFTAMLVGDGAYGLLSVIALAAMFRPLEQQGISKKLLEFFIILFAGVFVYGIITNTWFGGKLPYPGFDGSSEAGGILLQEFCFLLGAVHLSIAQLWKGWREPRPLLFLAEIGWTIFIWFIYALVRLLVLKAPFPDWAYYALYSSVSLILLFTSPSWNPLTTIGAGLGALAMNIASFLSDIISYIRLWAVGLASGILAGSFNEMAGQLPIIPKLLMLIGGHFINFSLGLVAVFAHGVRLNLLEFSNHLGMEWSGRGYDPFRKR